ncbi:MAG: zinc ribbon domain-containing protein [Desulfomonile tiedjei]|nr:zinc ribbon domain-containing protein [Desulfomonile tiedjei]
MADFDKRKISAKQIVADIRAGLDDARLQRKYGLSHEALESVYGKLIRAGALKEVEIRGRLASGSGENEESQEKGPTPGPLCPSCNAPVPTGSAECPKCGIVLSKFAPIEEPAYSVHLGPVDDSEFDSNPSRKWVSIALSIIVLAVCGVALILWAVHRDKEKLRVATADAPQAVEEVAGQSDASEEDASEDQSTEIDADSEPMTVESQEGVVATGEPEALEPAREGPGKEIVHSRAPVQSIPMPPADKGQYVTGELRRFTSADFKKEVVEASKTFPVIFQFYSDT